MSIGPVITVSILLMVMAEGNGYYLLKDVLRTWKTVADLMMRGYTVDRPVYSSDKPVIDPSNLSWENFDKLDIYIKISVASTERVANRTTDSKDIVQAIIQNPILKPNYTAPIQREDKFLPEKTGWFDFLKAKVDHMGEIKVWFKKVVNKNGYLKKFGTDFISTIASLSLSRLKHLRSTCENQVESLQEEQLMDLKIVELPGKNYGHVFVHVYTLGAWVDCESSANMGGLTYEYTKYSFTAREGLVDKMKQASKDKAVETLQCFLKKIFGPRPNSEGTPVTTRKPATTTTTTTVKPTTTTKAAAGITTTSKTKPTLNIEVPEDC